MIGRTERDTRRGGATRRHVRHILRLVAAAAGGAVVLLSLASPASAHHCGSLSDCFDSGRALLIALAALLIVMGIIAIFASGGIALPAFAIAGGGGVTASAGAIAVAAVSATAATGAAVTTGILLAEAAKNSPTGSSSGGSSRPDIPQRAAAEKPWVSNQKLRNIIDNLFKNTSKPDRVGNGTTMDAVRNEIRTGRPTAGKWHTPKLKQTAGDLVNWLQRNPSASAHDKQVVSNMLKRIENALNTTAR